MLDQRIRQLTAYASVFGGTPAYLEEYARVWDEIASDFKPEAVTRIARNGAKR